VHTLVENALTIATSLAAAAHHQVDPRRAAADVLDVLCAQAGVKAAALTTYDPVSDRHVTACSSGYPDRVLDHLQSPAFLVEDVGYQLLVRSPNPRARCWRDVDVDYTRTPSATRVFSPAGYAGGATARLTTTDLRYTGDLHLSTDDRSLPTRAMMTALHHVAPVLAAATDVTRRLSLLLGDLGPDARVALIADTGTVMRLPDRAPLELLAGVNLPRRVRAWRAGQARSASGSLGAANFHLLTPDGGRCLRLVAVAGGTVVVLEPAPPPSGLTTRELQVLSLLSGGLLNAAIARRLGISDRTVAHHVEHILGKLEVTSRTAATRRAVEDGLLLFP
jgi:DNA-binding CsgD family transcriptional regulator